MSALASARSLPMWRALSVRDFRLLWSSEAVSVIGDQFHFVALSWLVIDLTRSGLALGTILIAIAVPRALMLLPFGVLADRRPPRTLMLVAHLARGVVVGAIAALVLSGSASLPLLAILGAVFGALDALYLPAQQSFLPRTLDTDRLPSGNSLLQGTLQLCGIVGPPLAGAFIVAIGTGAAFVVDAASFFVAAAIVLLISGQGAVTAAVASIAPSSRATPVSGDRPRDAAPQPSFVAAVKEGVRYVLADPPLRTTLLISMLINFALNGPAAVGMPWLAEIRYAAGPTGLGLLTAGWAVGGARRHADCRQPACRPAGPAAAARRRVLRGRDARRRRGAVAPARDRRAGGHGRADRVHQHYRDQLAPVAGRDGDAGSRHEPGDAHGVRDHARVARRSPGCSWT